MAKHLLVPARRNPHLSFVSVSHETSMFRGFGQPRETFLLLGFCSREVVEAGYVGCL